MIAIACVVAVEGVVADVVAAVADVVAAAFAVAADSVATVGFVLPIVAVTAAVEIVL